MADEPRLSPTRRDETAPPLLSVTPSPNDEGSQDISGPIDGYASSDATAAPSYNDEAEPILAKRSITDISDTSSESPWSRKFLLALDGGGVRGYSSLLVVERLLSLVAELESGASMRHSNGKKYEFKSHPESGHCPWYSTSCHPGNTPNGTQQSSQYAPAADALHTVRPVQPVDHAAVPDRKDDLSKFRVHHYFDYVAGTSTGGLSAIMLSRMKMDISQALKQYDIVGNDVFGNPRFGYRNQKFAKLAGLMRPKYATKRIEDALHKVIRNGLKNESERTRVPLEDIVLSDCNTFACRTALVARGGYKNRVDGPYIFRSFDHPNPSPQTGYYHLNPGPARPVKLWKAARATSAAPLYFDKMVINGDEFKDGGLGANNPARLIAREITQIHGNWFPKLVVSIGTGRDTQSSPLRDSEDRRQIKRSRSIFRCLKDNMQLLPALEHIATDSEKEHQSLEEHMDGLRGKDSRYPNEPVYFRFNVEGITHVQLDEWEPPEDGSTTLGILREETNKYLARSDIVKKMRDCAIELVDLRRKRARTERWEQFATDTIYCCPLSESCKPWLEFSNRAELRQHAFDEHQHATWPLQDEQRFCSCESEDVRKAAYLRHLQQNHHMPVAQLKTQHEMETWLDSGRTTIKESIEKRESGLSHKEGSSPQPRASDNPQTPTSKHRSEPWLRRLRRDKSGVVSPQPAILSEADSRDVIDANSRRTTW